MKLKFLVLFALSIFIELNVSANKNIDLNPNYLKIRNVLIEGNKKTKSKIITRELLLKPGDSVSSSKIDSLLLWEKNKIFNTNLFITVDVYKVPLKSDSIDILIKVKEQWYTIPQIILEPSDRNLNEWLFQRGTSLERVNYGFKVFQRNCRGRNETLRLTFQQGFTRNYEISYEIPYLDKKQTIGIRPSFSYSNNNSIAYANNFHKLEFIKTDRIIRDFFKGGISVFYRKKFFSSHSIDIIYNHNSVADTVVMLNPDYFLDGRKFQRYFQLRYTFNLDKRDIRQYAHKGFLFKIEAEQAGISKYESQQISKLTLTYNKYFTLRKNIYLAHKIKSKFSYPFNQPFIDYKGLGYQQDYVRGFELYPIDGNAYLLSRNTIRWRFLSKVLNFGKYMPIPQFRTLPIDLYFNVFADGGYVQNSRPIKVYPSFISDNARFSNKLIGSIGAGLHIVTYYNSILRFEYYLNSAGEYSYAFSIGTDI